MAGFNLEPIAQEVMQRAAQMASETISGKTVRESINYLQQAEFWIQHVDRYNKYLALENARQKLKRNQELQEIQKIRDLADNEKLLSDKQVNRYTKISSNYSAYDKLEQAKNEILGDYKKNDIKESFTNLMICTQQYQKKIQKINGISMTTIFAINIDGEVIVYEENSEIEQKNLNQIFHMDKAADGGGLIARYNTTMNVLDDLNLYTSIFHSADQQNKDNYKRTLTEAYLILLKRIQVTKIKKSNKIFIPYKDNNEEKVAQISARGDLAEAYLKLLLNSQSNSDISIDEAIKTLLMGATKVTSLSGMFVGDFEITNAKGEKIQVAAKSLNASLAGYKQIIQFAKQIVNLAASGKLTDKMVEELVKKKSKGGGARNKLEVQIDEKIKEKIDSKLKEAINIVSL